MSYYLMHRGWMQNKVFEREPYNRRNAWEWMIENAAFSPSNSLERGQLRVSLRFLANTWGWQEPRVRRWLRSAQDANMIRSVTDAGRTLITICNYDQYQCSHSVGDAVPDAKPTQNRRIGDANLNKEEGRRNEESKKEDSDSVRTESAASASVVDDPPPDPLKAWWDRARASLTAAGVSKERVGPLLGRWRRDFGDSAVEHALDALDRDLPSDPISYVVGCLNAWRKKPNGRLTPANERFLAGREATFRAALEHERKAAAGEC